MKKVLVLVFVLIILLISSSNRDLKPVFSEVELEKNIYEITFSKGEMNTNKIGDYLDKFQILTIYPYVNPIYEKQLSSITSYSFKGKTDINKFVNYYINELDKNGFKQEAIWAKINGIAIKKIKVYANENVLLTLGWNYVLAP